MDRQTLDSWLVSHTEDSLTRRFFRILVPALFAAEAPELSLLHFHFYVKSGTGLGSQTLVILYSQRRAVRCHQRYMRTTQTPSDQSATNTKSSHAAGILPLIGTILFVIVTIMQFAGGAGEHWGPQLVTNAVTYMIGWAGVGAGISHLFFGRRISKTIGFEKSPYELEVGFADLSFGIVALMAANYSSEFALAVILASSIYRVGCGIGHIRSMIKQHNFAVNNTLILVTNFAVPAFLIFAYYAWA